MHAHPKFKTVCFPEHSTYDLVKAGWFATSDDFLTHFHEAEANGLYRTLIPFPGALDVVRGLQAAGDRVVVVTARKASFAADTRSWLDAHDLAPTDVIHTEAKHEVDADVFIEDANYQIQSLVENGRSVLAHSRPYNAHVDVPRFTSWKSVPELLHRFR